MKRYSRKQMYLFAAICTALVLFLGWVFGVLRWPQEGMNVSELDDLHSDYHFEDQEKPEKIADEPPAFEVKPIQFDDKDQSLDPSKYTEDELENILIYEKLNEAVVNITSVSFSYNWFLEPVPEEGTGSGSIIREDGTVLTNYHVIKGAKELTVTLADGSDYTGKVLGVDPENDLALIKFDPGTKKLKTISFGTSSNLRVGQKAVAIGNPFALQRTLTTGIVSGLGRPVRTSEGVVIKEMIQTDASINPGNSGGPLLNSRGEMIGINTMIYSPSGGSVGIGFAVPVDTAKRIIPDLIRYGEVRRGWIDIVPVQLFPQLVRYANLPVDQGILVSEVKSNSTAERAGLRGGSRNRAVRTGRSIIYLGGDIIIEVDKMQVKSLMDLYSALEDNKPGETVEVKIMRGTQKQTLRITLSERS
jgi:S1-C subfamily serine protease